ncbi:hypothetical protein J6590_029090 [Homalodisca vitripennis]|nr:hypothetical protein J6590_029090 [Homalodisca vitripennis]
MPQSKAKDITVKIGERMNIDCKEKTFMDRRNSSVFGGTDAYIRGNPSQSGNSERHILNISPSRFLLEVGKSAYSGRWLLRGVSAESGKTMRRLF